MTVSFSHTYFIASISQCKFIALENELATSLAEIMKQSSNFGKHERKTAKHICLFDPTQLVDSFSLLLNFKIYLFFMHFIQKHIYCVLLLI